jgi:hypothetical protein
MCAVGPVSAQVTVPQPVRDPGGLVPLEASLASQACCDLTTNDRTCFDDELGIGSVCLAPASGLGAGTSCAMDCPCTGVCNSCVGKESGNLASVEIALVDTAFDGVNTTFSYRICQNDGPALSHWVLGLDDACCARLVSASGGSTTQMCALDPTSSHFGVKFDTSPPPPCSPLACSGAGDLFTVVISGDVPVGCTKVATKASTTEDTATSCIQGPDCTTLCQGVDCSPMNTDCQTFTCNPNTGLCEGTFVPDMTPCSGDDHFCTGEEVCLGGVCVSPGDPCSGEAPICCENLNLCAEECCRKSDCPDDGLFCNGGQICVGGACQPTGNPCTGLTPVCCEDGRSCAEECCVDADCPDDGYSCTDEVCDAGRCVAQPFDGRCQPVNMCVDGVCDPFDPNADANGCLVVPQPPSTPCESDADECTVEHCDGAGNCVVFSEDDCSRFDTDCMTFTCEPGSGDCIGSPTPPGTPCEADGDLCTEDHCDGAGDCVLLHDRYQDCVCSVDCTSCNPSTGSCEPDDNCDGTPCEDDGFNCTDDVCIEGKCHQEPIPGACDDGNVCTVDICDPGTPERDSNGCVFVPEPLSTPCATDLDPCTTQHCDGLGACVVLDQVDCSSLDTACETFTCDPGSGGCVGSPRPAGTTCTPDEDLCTEHECDDAGNCVLVRDGNEACVCADDCTQCDPLTGACAASAACDGAVCADDGFACTRDECLDGQCTHTPVPGACDDGDDCTSDVCDPMHVDADAGGCVFTPQPVGTPCETDDDLCTTEQCDGDGACVVFETVSCSELDTECATHACDPESGECVMTPEPAGKPCNVGGGDLCVVYACDATGACAVAGGGTVECSCEVDCTECNPDTGQCEPSVGCDGGPCADDGFACTEDRCVDGVCTHTPIAGFCVGGGDCMQSACDPGHPDADADGCVLLPRPLSTPCEADENRCTEDHCDGQGQCVLFHDRNDDCSCEENCSACNPSTGQCGPSLACNGAVCGEADFACTAFLCADGFCELQILPDFCDDSATCSDEVCNPFHPNADPQTGCVNDRIHARCGDGTVCTDDACAPGAPGADPVTGCLFIDNGTCGACCDRAVPGGDCVDGAEPGDCVGSQMIHYPAETCEVVEAEGRCLEHTGACCDRRIADPVERCHDDVPESECIIDDPNQVRWYKFTRCADLSSGECSEHTGACCDELSGTCTDDVPESACSQLQPDPLQRSWSKDQPCSEVMCIPATGACCNADAGPLATEGICEVTTLAECRCEKCIWTKEASCDAIDCQNVFVTIPTVSEWGLLILTLLLLIGAKIYFGAHPARHGQPA